MSEQEAEINKEDYEALARFRYALRRFLHFSEEAARAEGVTPQQHQLLLGVKGQPGQEWASVGTLAEYLQIRPHAAVGLVARCVEAGLVERAVSPTDKRQVQVSLTPKGAQILTRLSRRHRAELQMLRHALLLPFLLTADAPHGTIEAQQMENLDNADA